MDDTRLSSLEDDLRPESDGVEDYTINVVYVETFFDEHGERHERNLPARYSEDVPYREPFYRPDLKRWQRWRVRYPLEQSADHGIVRDREVTGD